MMSSACSSVPLEDRKKQQTNNNKINMCFVSSLEIHKEAFEAFKQECAPILKPQDHVNPLFPNSDRETANRQSSHINFKFAA